SGDVWGCLQQFEAAAASFERSGNLRGISSARGNVGFLYIELGAYAEAEVALREALAAAERMGLRHGVVAAQQNLGLVLARKGALAEARAIEVEVADTFRGQGDRRMEGISRVYLAQILTLAGDLDAARREAESAVELASASPPTHALALASLASIHLA